MKEKEHVKAHLRIGLLSGLIASVCCVSPLVIALIGLASVSAAMGLMGGLRTYTPLVILISGLFMVGAVYVHLRRHNACSIQGLRARKYGITAMIVTWIVTYILLLYIIVPYIFKILP